MVTYFGDFAEDDTVLIPFNTFDSNDPSASVTITDLADADLKVHKDGSITQIVTDGATIAIDFDGITGNHLATIDTSVDAEYSTGSEYAVRMEGTTVDGATINAWIGCFSIERAGGALALIKAGNLSSNVVQISGDSVAADNAEAFFDGTGYAGTGNTIPTVTTLTGHTAQTGDSFARIGATGSGLTSLAQASVLGALADAAAAGDPTTADTLMQYVKQLVNVLVGTTGITTFPAEQAPANNINLAEVLRAVHADVTGLNGDAMRGTDSAALASVATEARLAELDAANLPSDVDAILVDTGTTLDGRIPAALVGGRMDANVGAISADATAADRLEGMMDGVLIVQVNDASATTTAAAFDGFTEATDDHFNGRLLTFISGALTGQQTAITDYDAAGHAQGSQAMVYDALTEAPADDDFAVVH